MTDPQRPKRPYVPPQLTSVKIFLPMLAAKSGGHPHTKKPFPPFH